MYTFIMIPKSRYTQATVFMYLFGWGKKMYFEQFHSSDGGQYFCLVSFLFSKTEENMQII